MLLKIGKQKAYNSKNWRLDKIQQDNGPFIFYGAGLPGGDQGI